MGDDGDARADDDDSEPRVREPVSKSTTTSSGQNERRKRSYVPKKGSGSYALLIALLIAERDEGREELNKEELMQSAQPFADESMTKPRPGSHYTAFNSMKTLVSNELVERHQSRNSFYRLTQSGRELAQKLIDYAEKNGTGPRGTVRQSEGNSDSSDECEQRIQSQRHERLSLPAGTFELVLLVDTREQSSGVEQGLRKTAIITELSKRGVQAEMRALPVGDFAWIARKKQPIITSTDKSPELLMDVVIERKRADDLASSIVDGRFKEQKHRLLRSGVRKPTYLVEGLVRADYSVPYRNLLQAVTNSQVVDGFDVKMTLNHSESIAYLSIMTKQLTARLASTTLLSCTHSETQDHNCELPENYFMTFSEYEKGSKKITNFTVSEMFLKHLIQFSGMTVVKAKAVTTLYPTLSHLIQAYDNCATEKQREKMLAGIKYGTMVRGVGPVLSSKVYKYYNYE